MAPLLLWGLGAILAPACLAGNYFKYQQVLWPSDPDKLDESPQPSRFACGSWCSALGTDVCSAFEFTASKECKVGNVESVSIPDLLGLKKGSWLKRASPVTTKGGC